MTDGIPFSFILDEDGDIWACYARIGNKEVHYVNIKDGIVIDNPNEFFRKTKAFSGDRNIAGCRFEYMNEYLYKSKKPSEHDILFWRLEKEV